MSSPLRDDPLVPVPKSTIPSRRSKQNVLSRSRDINGSLQVALTNASTGNLEQVTQNLRTVQDHFKAVEQYLSISIEPAIYNELRSSDSTIAEKVFAIPELLEAILLRLVGKDIMHCYGVSRTFRDTIERSQKLQTTLFLRPTATVTGTTRWFMWQRKPLRLSGGSEFYGSIVRPKSPNGSYPTIGSRWKSMLVRQPPLQKACYQISGDQGDGGCCVAQGGANELRQMERDDGLTVGDFLEKAEALFKAHLGCKDGCRVINFFHIRRAEL